jgi:hypothetical protein
VSEDGVPQPLLVRDWPAAAATGVGSMPGTDPVAAARLVRDRLARDGAVPHLVELPARGPGADLLGRAMGLLAQVWPVWAVQTTPTGWRLSDAPGHETRRAGALLDQDLDVLEEQYDGWAGPLVLPIAGPWTLVAGIELAGGQRLISDAAAVRDLLECWGEAAARLAGQVRRRLPAAAVVVQADEPSLPAVLAGALPTASGLAHHRAVEPTVVRDGVAATVARLDADRLELLVHCCAAGVPVALLRDGGAAGVGVDLARLDAAGLDAVGECVESGVRIGLGVVASTGAPSAVGTSVVRVEALAARLGFGVDALAAAVTISPTCGLAGASAEAAGRALDLAYATGRVLRGEQERA